MEAALFSLGPLCPGQRLPLSEDTSSPVGGTEAPALGPGREPPGSRPSSPNQAQGHPLHSAWSQERFSAKLLLSL